MLNGIIISFYCKYVGNCSISWKYKLVYLLTLHELSDI